MLEPVLNVLNGKRIILASSSPRRQELLKKMGLKFDVIPSLYEEDLDPTSFHKPEMFVETLAEYKAKEVFDRLTSQNSKFDFIIAADTIVYKDDKVHGKPKSYEEAFEFLKSFSGSDHSVYTGVALKDKTHVHKFSECTKVYFGRISDTVIKRYLDTGEYKDKAGGYGLQDKGGSFVKRVEGDPFNVIGLPLFAVTNHLLHYSSLLK